MIKRKIVFIAKNKKKKIKFCNKYEILLINILEYI